MEGAGGGLSKSQKKNLKRKQKKKDGGDSEASGGSSKPQTAEDWLPILKEQLEKAKADMDNKLARKLRQQIWVLTDMARGVKTDIEDEKFEEIVKGLPKNQEGDEHETPAPADAKQETTTAEKRLRNLRKRLEQIEKLKEKKRNGESLEKNQLDKIETEEKILEEMEELRTLLAKMAV